MEGQKRRTMQKRRWPMTPLRLMREDMKIMSCSLTRISSEGSLLFRNGGMPMKGNLLKDWKLKKGCAEETGSQGEKKKETASMPMSRVQKKKRRLRMIP